MNGRDGFGSHDYFAPEEPAAPPTDGDAIDHLWNAAHEMLRAMRTLIDAADEFVDAQRAERPAARGNAGAREGRVHHIDIDLRADSSRETDADLGTSSDAS